MKNILYIIISLTFFTGCDLETQNTDNHYKGLKAVIVPESNYVLMGDEFKSTIYFNRKIIDDIEIVGVNSAGFYFQINDEKIFVTKKCTSVGENTLYAKVYLKKNEIIFDSLDINHTFIVAQNSFYLVNSETATSLILNTENKLEVSVAGYSISDLKLESDNGIINGTIYSPTITPEKIGECKISIFVKKDEGYEKIGERPFTVKKN